MSGSKKEFRATSLLPKTPTEYKLLWKVKMGPTTAQMDFQTADIVIIMTIVY